MQAAISRPPTSVTPSHSGIWPVLLASVPTSTAAPLRIANQAGMSQMNPRGYLLAGPRTRHVTVSSTSRLPA